MCKREFRHPTPRSPRDDVGSEAEHEGADEGADLPGGSLPSPLLLLQATLPDTGDSLGEFRISGRDLKRTKLS